MSEKRKHQGGGAQGADSKKKKKAQYFAVSEVLQSAVASADSSGLPFLHPSRSLLENMVEGKDLVDRICLRMGTVTIEAFMAVWTL